MRTNNYIKTKRTSQWLSILFKILEENLILISLPMLESNWRLQILQVINAVKLWGNHWNDISSVMVVLIYISLPIDLGIIRAILFCKIRFHCVSSS